MKVKVTKGYYWVNIENRSFIVEARKIGTEFKFFRTGSEEPLNISVKDSIECSKIENPFIPDYSIYGIRDKENGWWMERFSWGDPETYWCEPDRPFNAKKLNRRQAKEMLKEMNRGYARYIIEPLPGIDSIEIK